jgi:hypothetical protein
MLNYHSTKANAKNIVYHLVAAKLLMNYLKLWQLE